MKKAGLAIAAAALLCTTGAPAQTAGGFPAKQIRVIVPLAAGIKPE